MDLSDLQAFTEAYVYAALWSSPVGEDAAAQLTAEYAESGYARSVAPDVSMESYGFTIGDLDSSARANVNASCESFIRANLDLLAGLDAQQCGYDFWLTRNRHGTGFWDRGLGVTGERLSVAAAPFGESVLYIGDDGRLYVS